MKFRKKPIEVEAYQLTEEKEIHTREGTLKGYPGDWIITGIQGEQYPCGKEIFEQTYEPAESRPHPPAPELPCDTCYYNRYPCATSTKPKPEICSDKEEWLQTHDATIAAKAREDVLDKLEKSFQCTPNTGRETQYELGFRQGMTHAICEVKSLRREVQE